MLSGSGGFAGEIGHVTINYRGQKCSCGRRGCIENYINLNAVVERISQIARLSTGSSLFVRMEENDGRLNLAMIRDAYNSGDADVIEAVNDVAVRLLLGAYSVACTTGVSRVVIGGGIEALGAGFLNRLRQLADKDGAGNLLYGLNFDYGRLKPAEAGLGVVQYFVDKCFGLR